MKELPSVELLNQLLSYNPKTGMLINKVNRCKAKRGEEAGCIGADKYRAIKIDKQLYKAHRLIWKMIHGVDPNIIDHKNRNKSDNRLCNLRNVTLKENSWNGSLRRNNKSGHIGVFWNKKNKIWIAELTYQGNRVYLGSFKQKKDAIKAYKAEKAKRHLINK